MDDQDVPLEETLDAFAGLVKAGKVRAIGASNYSAARLREALSISQQRGLPRYELMQPLYNLYDRADFEAELAELAEEHRLGVVTYFSLASGFLTGKYRSVEYMESAQAPASASASASRLSSSRLSSSRLRSTPQR